MGDLDFVLTFVLAFVLALALREVLLLLLLLIDAVVAEGGVWVEKAAALLLTNRTAAAIRMPFRINNLYIIYIFVEDFDDDLLFN